MHVLVTGGAGFVGSHLVEALLAAGDSVTVLDDLSTGRRAHVPAAARLLRADVRDGAAVATGVAEADLVYHLAAAVGPGLVARDPAGTWSRNVRGTACVLEACAAAGRRVLLASSSEVYGPRREGPFREDEAVQLQPGARRDVYALSKAAGEAYALALHRSSLLPVVVARLFNVVGPRQSGRYGMVLPRFVDAALGGRPLPVYGDGRQRRCFLHVDDAVEALRRLAACEAAVGRIVNVGSREEVEVGALARRVGRRLGRRVAIDHVPFERVYGEGFVDPRRRVPDVGRLERLTGFTARKGLDDAIADLAKAAEAVPTGPRPPRAAPSHE